MERLKRIVVWALAALTALPAQPAGAAPERRYGETAVYVYPTKGGSSEDRAYFNFNMQEEIKGAGYTLTNLLYREEAAAKENSDYYIALILDYDEVYKEHTLTADLYDTRTGNHILSSIYGYKNVEDMDQWNLTIIYSLMANAPLIKKKPPGIIADAYGLPGGEQQHRVYLGPRTGYSTRFYRAPSGTDYVERTNLASAFQLGAYVSFRPKPFLSIQAEVLFTMDFASFTGFTGTSLNHTEYRFASLMFPLTLGAFLRIGPAFVAPLAGVYAVLPLGDFTVSPLPLGFTAGVEAGAQLRWGTIFLDIRYAADFGETHLDDGTSLFRRSMVAISLGYGWGFSKKQK
jgi:hypothetical protein